MENKVEYKNTKIGWIPNDWTLYKMRDLSEKIMVGIASSATHAYSSQGIPMFRNQNIKDSGLDDSDILFINESYEKIHKNKRLKEGDILTVRTGYPGLSCVVPRKYEGAQCFTSLIIRPKKDLIDSDWLVFYINSPLGKKLMKALEAGGAQKNINSGSLEKLLVPLLNLPEQKKIAKILSTWDKAIEHTQNLIEQLKKRKKGLMQALFTGEIRLKKENGSLFPDWEQKRLNYYLQVSKLKNFEIKYDKSDVLSVSGEFGIVNQIEFQGRSFAGKSVANYGVVEKGDIVYTKSPLKSNPYGIIKVNKGENGIVSTLYSVYKCKPTVSGEYLDYYFQLDDNVNSYLRPLVQKGSKNDMKINNDKVLIDEVFLPSKEEQEAIVKLMQSVDKEINQQKEYLVALQNQKKGLMQQLLTGQKRVSVT